MGARLILVEGYIQSRSGTRDASGGPSDCSIASHDLMGLANDALRRKPAVPGRPGADRTAA